jgi:hypothetical protein
MFEIVQVAPHVIEMAEGIKIDMPALAYIGKDGDQFVGSGGLAWGGGRCWIWLRMDSSKPQYAIPLMRKTKALIDKAHQFGEAAVFTPRDPQFPTSEKLLTVLGFKLFAIENGVEVWRHVRA